MDRSLTNCYTVYCHISPSGKKYVGISKDPWRRWNNGNGYRHNYHFYRAIEKYGWENFEHIILYTDLTLERARDIEERLIIEQNLTNREYGYNLIASPSGGYSEDTILRKSLGQLGNTKSVGRVLSEETRRKISESLRIYYKTHENPSTGRPLPESAKEKLRNRIFSQETRQKMSANHADFSGVNNPSHKSVMQFSKTGELIKIYDYAKQAAEELSIDLSAIIKVCRGKMKTCGGYIWRYTDATLGTEQ